MTWRDNKKQVVIYMEPDVHNELKKIALVEGQSINNTILKLISLGMDKHEQLKEDDKNDLKDVFDNLKNNIFMKLERIESSILKELGFQGTESLKDRDAIKEEMARLSRKLDMRLR